MPNKLSKFWQELRRRRVLRSLAIYAGSAFIILEAATIVFPRWGLPDWTIDLVLYLLILGVFVTIVVAWIFDITPEGVQKTKPFTEVRVSEKTTDSNTWKVATYISVVIIVALIIFNVVPFKKKIRAGSIDSLVILPFNNFTGDDQLDNMVSSMHSMLIGDIGRISRLRVISPTTANVYKNAEKSIPEIATELGVNGVIDLDVMCLGDTVCLQAKVISPYPEEKLLWIADYKVEKSQMLNLYSQITKQIADEVKIELSSEEEQRLAESRTVNPEALDAYLRGRAHWERHSEEELDSALHYFRIAVEKDPDWAEPYAGMAMTWYSIGLLAYGPVNESFKQAEVYLDKALELEPNSANSHYVRAMLAVWVEADWKKGEQEYLKTLELNPSDALGRIYYSRLLILLCRFDEALYQANLAHALDPKHPLVLTIFSSVLRKMGNYETALMIAEEALALDPAQHLVINDIAEAYLAMGDTLKWYNTVKKWYYWTDTAYLVYLDSVFHKGGYLAVIKDRIRVNEEVLRTGGTISYTGQAERHIELGEYDRAMDYYEKAYEANKGLLANLALYAIRHPELKSNPRYIALMNKMNLPLVAD